MGIMRIKQSEDGNFKIRCWLVRHACSISIRNSADLADWCSRETHMPVTKANIDLVLKNMGIQKGRDIPENLVKAQIEIAIDLVLKNMGIQKG